MKKAKIDVVTTPFRKFLQLESAGGILLVFITFVAMAWANSPWGEGYFHFWHTSFSIGFGSFELSKSLHHWINDGLMAIFFFVVGLEIKREFIKGHLSTFKKAALPAAGALGGMVAPALIYFSLNPTGPAASGWGVPMATDIAFALGILMLLGNRVPIALKVALTAIAIVDDLGAVMVIALFYTEELSVFHLMVGNGLLAVAAFCNWLDIRKPLVYAGIGVIMWFMFLKSGVHATVAGVLLAMAIPARTRTVPKDFRDRSKDLLRQFDAETKTHPHEINSKQGAVLQALEDEIDHVQSPMAVLEHALLPVTTFFIMPIFALANAGVKVEGSILELFTLPPDLGIMLGLFFGKLIGISGFSYLAVRAGIASLPKGVTWPMMLGLSLLGGVGFTMAIFIANLAFSGDAYLLASAKLSILIASATAGVVGYTILRRVLRKP